MQSILDLLMGALKKGLEEAGNGVMVNGEMARVLSVESDFPLPVGTALFDIRYQQGEYIIDRIDEKTGHVESTLTGLLNTISSRRKGMVWEQIWVLYRDPILDLVVPYINDCGSYIKEHTTEDWNVYYTFRENFTPGVIVAVNGSSIINMDIETQGLIIPMPETLSLHDSIIVVQAMQATAGSISRDTEIQSIFQNIPTGPEKSDAIYRLRNEPEYSL